MQKYTDIPSLDLLDFTNGTSQSRDMFVNALGKAYSEIGFVAIKNHGFDMESQNRLYQAVKSFFELPDMLKTKNENPQIKGQPGQFGKLKERGEGNDAPDRKEFFHIGQRLEDEESETLGYPENIFPDVVSDLETYGIKAYEALELAGIEMLRAIARQLGLSEFYFDAKVIKGNSILRPIHYFPIKNPALFPDGAVRAAEHTDINLITLLMGASADGLQVLRHDGQWIPITALPGQIVVNVGDMLSRLTNNKLKSTVHRVVNPPGDQLDKPRISIPCFMHPRSEMDLSCLPSCIDKEHSKAFPDITAGDYLEKRSKAIGF